ncbi:unnamed protein product [Nippostrongylus brasiliensis]|uniref:Transthyretin-like family protein n=1 Tax=Nippostrongylus brasiliensis TaxID=27835 RepID=A0A0N4Y198_NIPBR|nr:unnamed protein product [Nippostrongylus brasiliensis]
MRILLFLMSTPLVLDALLTQSVGIRGVLRCGRNSLKNHKVELYEKMKSPRSDALMATNTTDSEGLFYLGGSTSSVLPLSPVLVVKDCKGKVR